MIIASVSYIAWREAVLRRRVARRARRRDTGRPGRGGVARPSDVRDSPGN
jgi:hypothetical protein